MLSAWDQRLDVDVVGVALHINQWRGQQVRSALGLLIKDVVSRITEQGTVVSVEEHLFWTLGRVLALGLLAIGAKEEDGTMGVTGGNIEMVGTPLGVIDCSMTLGLNDIVVLE